MNNFPLKLEVMEKNFIILIYFPLHNSSFCTVEISAETLMGCIQIIFLCVFF